MESSKIDEIVSLSLILQPPEGYNCKDFLIAELLSIFDEESAAVLLHLQVRPTQLRIHQQLKS